MLRVQEPLSIAHPSGEIWPGKVEGHIGAAAPPGTESMREIPQLTGLSGPKRPGGAWYNRSPAGILRSSVPQLSLPLACKLMGATASPLALEHTILTPGGVAWPVARKGQGHLRRKGGAWERGSSPDLRPWGQAKEVVGTEVARKPEELWQ